MKETLVVEKISREELQEILQKYEGRIKVSVHATDHLSNAQRKIFKDDKLIKPLVEETPAGAGRQNNQRISVFYRRGNGYLRIILAEKIQRLEIVTFTETDTMPNFGRLK